MKVYRDSWHYKFNSFLDGAYTTESDLPNLCRYFWRTIYNLFIVIVVIGICVGFLFKALPYFFAPGGLNLLIGIFCIIAMIILPVLAISIFRDYGLSEKTKIRDPKFINYVKEYSKAKKNKYCPIIEYVDREKEKENLQ